MAARSLTLSAWSARRLPDEDIFDRTLRGDPVAFSEVYRRYQKRVHGYCLARSLDPEAAADATQEVFMKLLRAAPGSIENPRAWLFTIARNVVIDVVRKRNRTPEDPGVDAESLAWDRLKSADTADEVLARSDARNVFLALRTMRPRYRTALVMRDVHEQSAKDMAEALELTPGAVDTLVSRARDAFGVAYASVSGLPPACRANVELIYRDLGTGVTDQEQAALQAHISECARCDSEAKRAQNPRHLAALLPFLLPVKALARNLLHRAAMTVRQYPDVATQQVTPLLAQPQTWNLATKIAAGVLAATMVAAPLAVTSTRSSSGQSRAAMSAFATHMSSWRGGSSSGWLSMRTNVGWTDMGSWSNAWYQGPMSGSAGVGSMSGWSSWSSSSSSMSGGSGSGSCRSGTGTSSGAKKWSGGSSGTRSWGSSSGTSQTRSGSSSSGSGSCSSRSGSWSSGGGTSTNGGWSGSSTGQDRW